MCTPNRKTEDQPVDPRQDSIEEQNLLKCLTWALSSGNFPFEGEEEDSWIVKKDDKGEWADELFIDPNIMTKHEALELWTKIARKESKYI